MLGMHKLLIQHMRCSQQSWVAVELWNILLQEPIPLCVLQVLAKCEMVCTPMSTLLMRC